MRTARLARRGPMSTTGRSPACRRSPRGNFWSSSAADSADSKSPSSCAGLTRVSINLQKRWMAGSSSAKTRFALLPGHDEAVSTRIQPFTLDADIHLALDVIPFLGRAQHADQFLERLRVRGLELEPGQEIEGLAEIAAVIELARDRRQIFQACGDVVRLVLEDLPPLLLRQLPPGRRFLDRDQRGAGRLGAAESG